MPDNYVIIVSLEWNLLIGCLPDNFSLVFWPSSLTASKNCSALVWGSSVKHKPQRVGKVCIRPARCYIVTHPLGVRFLALIYCAFVQEHELDDEDVVQIIKKI